MAVAFLLALLLTALAGVSLRYQFRNFARLRGSMLPSDDRRYLRGQCRRRTLNAVLLLVLAGLLAGAYVSGGQQEFDRIADKKDHDAGAELTDDDREFIKQWSVYWMVSLGLIFCIVVIAMRDYLATGLYGREQLRRIQKEQRTLLDRDLAVYRQQVINDRMRGR